MSRPAPGGNGAPGALERFFEHLRCARRFLRDPGLPADPAAVARQVAPDADLLSRFAAEATASGMSVSYVSTGEAAGDVAKLLAKCAVRSVLLSPLSGSAFTLADAAALQQVLVQAGFGTTFATDDETMFCVDAAVTGVVAAIAETGTIVCPSGRGSTRGASLIPPIHVALVGSWQILADLCDYLAHLGGKSELPASLSLISGPSKTADIEGVLVTGVHGPAQVHVLVVS